ncbi:ROK family protein [Sulfitobacter pontiacus]|uniref:glucokinase n=1 Tax=Sulfitobacter pontiacus TaxID=60137 RepID=UPI0032994583
MWNLIADVGGTNMRLACVAADGQMLRQQTLPSKGDVGLEQACGAFAKAEGSAPTHVVIAAAGIVANGRVTLTNANQSASEPGLVTACGAQSAKILNDFEAAAWSLETVTKDEVKTLQGQGGFTPGARLIIGPGTGLGVGALVMDEATTLAVPGEGGHVGIGPRRSELVPVFEALVALWPEVAMSDLTVEAEAVLSGTGLPYFYRAVAQAMGQEVQPLQGPQIFAAAAAQSDPVALRTVALFGEYLGAVAGDLAVTVKAMGGVFVTGGVVHKNPHILDQAFLAAFNAGGRYHAWRQNVPVYLYENENFGLIGARNCAQHLS